MKESNMTKGIGFKQEHAGRLTVGPTTGSTEEINLSHVSRRDFCKILSLIGVGGVASFSTLIPEAALAAGPSDRIIRTTFQGQTSLAGGHRHTYRVVLHPDGRIVGSTNRVRGHRHRINTTIDKLRTGFAGRPSHSHTLEPEIAIEEPEKTWGEPLEIRGGPFDRSATVVIVKDPERRPLHLPIVEVTPTSILTAVVPLKGQIDPMPAQLEVITAGSMSRPAVLQIFPPVAKPTPEEALADLASAIEEEAAALAGLSQALEDRLARFREPLDHLAQERLNQLRIAFTKVQEELDEARRLIAEIPTVPIEELPTIALVAERTREMAQGLVRLSAAIAQAPPPPVKPTEIIIACVIEIVALVRIQVVAIIELVSVRLVFIPDTDELRVDVEVVRWVFVLVKVIGLVLIVRCIVIIIDP